MPTRRQLGQFLGAMSGISAGAAFPAIAGPDWSSYETFMRISAPRKAEFR